MEATKGSVLEESIENIVNSIIDASYSSRIRTVLFDIEILGD